MNIPIGKETRLSQDECLRREPHMPCQGKGIQQYALSHLWAAVLRQALEDACSSHEKFAQHALSWICPHDSGGAGSFSFVCTAVDIDPQLARRMIAERLRRNVYPRIRQRALLLEKDIPEKLAYEGAA